jgi:hypothetical protein
MSELSGVKAEPFGRNACLKAVRRHFCNRLQFEYRDVRRDRTKMVGIADVAKKANVSTATVSRVLTKPETVRERTTEKVLGAIKELDYQPNALARQLRRLETNTILQT